MSPTEAPRAGHLAQVVYSRGKLEVNADNSSLNQILRDVCRLTGMKITGGLVDERVFGKYGPSAPAELLASLLNGTGSNMLLTETAAYAPSELILTPRQGGATPPGPDVSRSDDVSLSQQEVPVAEPASAPMPEAAVNPTGRQAVVRGGGEIATPSASPGASGSTDVKSSDSVSPQAPNVAQSPQQIYQQLQQLQQQQQANQK